MLRHSKAEQVPGNCGRCGPSKVRRLLLPCNRPCVPRKLFHRRSRGGAVICKSCYPAKALFVTGRTLPINASFHQPFEPRQIVGRCGQARSYDRIRWLGISYSVCRMLSSRPVAPTSHSQKQMLVMLSQVSPKSRHKTSANALLGRELTGTLQTRNPSAAQEASPRRPEGFL